ncbi:hypothetical protein B5S29_g1533 [[Candida] boidinii]|uniref:Unnamed protein product n=1 Tax=Candida boidinii TaxID=5477 RepID=A0ACB5TJL4_CANBO|nr:hypothetical protein B5S29_g1533 [[Candida] boidinii]GME89456.1 unnamed protein product [[Candida] boidinii]
MGAPPGQAKFRITKPIITEKRKFQLLSYQENMDKIEKIAAESTIQKPKRRRKTGGKHQMSACCACKKKRKKCDGGYPQCSGCVRSGVKCTIVDGITGREIPRNHLETLENLIHSLKSDCSSLKEVIGTQANTLKVLETKNKELENTIILDSLASSSIPDQNNKSYNGSSSITNNNFPETNQTDTEDISKRYQQTIEKGKDLSLEVGLLSLGSSEAGFLGASSAYSIAKALSHSIGYKQFQKEPNSYNNNSTDNNPDNKGTESEQDTDMELSFKGPTLQMGKKYLEAYKSTVQCQYPFMDWDWVLEVFEDVVLNDSKNPEALFFIYMIFAIGCQLLDFNSKISTSINIKAYYNKAFESVGTIIEGSTLRTVQAYLIMSVFSQKMPDGTSIWQTTGLAIRTAVALGLHREPYSRKQKLTNMRSFTTPTDTTSDEFQTGSGYTGVNSPELSDSYSKVSDLKSRIFWSAYGMERINGLVLGRPFSIADIDIDAAYPVDNEENSVAIHVIRLRRMQSNICSFVYKPHKIIEAPEEIDATRVQILLELNDWMSTFPAKSNPASTFETDNWSIISYHNSILLLLRPVILEVAKLKENSSPRLLEWFKVFTQSASAVCLNYKHLHSKGKLSYTWLSIHCCFVSGLSFLYCIWIDKSIKVLEWKRKSHIYDTISACSTILYVWAEKWDGAKLFRDTFDKLSKIVLSFDDNNSNVGMFLRRNSDECLKNGVFVEGSIGIDQYLSYEMNKDYTIDNSNTIIDQNEGGILPAQFASVEGSKPPGVFEKNGKDDYGSIHDSHLKLEDNNDEIPNVKLQNHYNGGSTGRAGEVLDFDSSLWEFLNSTGDRFLRDIFYEMEDNLYL